MLTLVIQGPISRGYLSNIENLLKIFDFVKIQTIWCHTADDIDQEQFSSIDIQILEVPDCGSILVKYPPHFANTNRMFLTTKSAFDKIHIDSSHVLKLRSDLAVTDEIKFRSFISELLCAPPEHLYCISQSNHDWDLPFNLADWCYGGSAPELRKMVKNLYLLSPNSGISNYRSFCDYIFGYVKKNFSPRYTTEQVFGSLLFSKDVATINSYSGFNSWRHIRQNNLRVFSLSQAGLSSAKHETITSPNRKSKNIINYVFGNFLKNIFRSQC